MKATRRRRMFWFVVLVTVVAVSGSWRFRAKSTVDVATALVTAGTIERPIVAVGTLQGVTTVEVGSQASGVVQSVDVDFNSIVHTGQVLARLDPSLFQAACDQASAELRGAQAALAEAQADVAGLRAAERDAQIKLERAAALAQRDLIQRADLDAAVIAKDEASADVTSGEARVAQANGGVDRARAAVDQAVVDLSHTVIRSPIDGIVIERAVDVGQTLAASVQSPVLFRIAADLSRMEVQVDVDESDIGGVTVGEPATFRVESYPGETFAGTVSGIRLQPVAETAAPSATGSPAAPSTIVSYATIVDAPNAQRKLRPGMTAQVRLPGSRHDHVVRIPNSALSFRPSPDVLIAMGETSPSSGLSAARARAAGGEQAELWQYDGKRFTPIVVRVGLANDEWTELVDGMLRAGDSVVTNAVLNSRSGR